MILSLLQEDDLFMYQLNKLQLQLHVCPLSVTRLSYKIQRNWGPCVVFTGFVDVLYFICDSDMHPLINQ